MKFFNDSMLLRRSHPQQAVDPYRLTQVLAQHAQLAIDDVIDVMG